MPFEEDQLRQEKSQLQEQVRMQQEVIERQSHQIALRTAQVEDLHARLSKDSHQSQLPPSCDRFKRQPKSLRKKSGKPAGGQPGHPGQHLQMVEPPDQVISHVVETCPACQHDLRAVPTLQLDRRQVIELPPKRVVVIEHQAERQGCPACQEVILAPFPADVTAPVQYGPALGAVAVSLVQQRLLHQGDGHPLSKASIVHLVQQGAEQLSEVEQHSKTALIHPDVRHQDETGLSVAGKRHWVQVSATATLRHDAAHPKRGKEALGAIGILPNFQGVSVHDGWRSYWADACQHATCTVHLLRDLTFLWEEPQQDWAQQLKDLLLSMKEAVEQARGEGRPTGHPLEVADWQAQDQAILLEAEAAQPRDLSPPVKGTGRRKQSAARNLLDRLSKQQEAVPFDNNLAERDLRLIQVQQKISACFRSFAGASAFCRIRG
jgi:transposase